MSLRVCAQPGCPALSDQTRCEQHRKAKRRSEDKRRPNGTQRGWTKEWRRTRQAFLAAFPVCQWHEGCLAPAVDVHHVDGCGRTGERAHDWGNLLAYCHPHHAQVTSQEQPGGWNRSQHA